MSQKGFKIKTKMIINATSKIFLSCLTILFCQLTASQETTFTGGQEENAAESVFTKEAVALGPPLAYHIRARLLPESNLLMAEMTLNWTNRSSRAIEELRFHTYYNAFNSPLTTFMKGGKNSSDPRRQKKIMRFGGIDIEEFRLDSGPDIRHLLWYDAPDDGNEHDRTVLVIPLKEPFLPGRKASMNIRFRLRIPEIIARTGSAGDYFFLGQWFPKIGVLQEDGSWHCHQFHRHSEFFADFARYRVEITLPSAFQVGASGNLKKTEKNEDGSKTHYFQEDWIHDFAWTAWPQFIRHEEELLLPGKREETKLILLLAPGNEKARERYLKSLKTAMEYFAHNLFPYPYRTITIVDPPAAGLASAGMEYPTLITGAYSPFLPYWVKLTELVTIHEFSHQYWQGMIASDEFREAWLDEGLATFYEMEIMAAMQGKKAALLDNPFLPLFLPTMHRMFYRLSPSLDPVKQNSWSFIDGKSYSANVYSKAGLFIKTMANYIGHGKMHDFLKAFALRYRFAHPKSADFVRMLSEFSGQDLAWAFQQFIYDAGRLDHAVKSVHSWRDPMAESFFFNEVTLVRHEGYFPVELLLVMDDGREIRLYWQDRERWKKIHFRDRARISKAVLDPENLILLDSNFLNNSMTVKPDRRLLRRSSHFLAFIFQCLLGGLIL